MHPTHSKSNFLHGFFFNPTNLLAKQTGPQEKFSYAKPQAPAMGLFMVQNHRRFHNFRPHFWVHPRPRRHRLLRRSLELQRKGILPSLENNWSLALQVRVFSCDVERAAYSFIIVVKEKEVGLLCCNVQWKCFWPPDGGCFRWLRRCW